MNDNLIKNQLKNGIKNQQEGFDKEKEGIKDLQEGFNKQKKSIKKILFLIKKFILKIIKIIIVKYGFILVTISFGLLSLITFILLPIILIISAINDATFFIKLGIPVVVNVVKDIAGNIISFKITELPGVKIDGISGYKYVIDGKKSDEKGKILSNINNTIYINTKNIKSSIGLDEILGKYKQSVFGKIINIMLFFEDKEANFEEVKKALENIYKLKYNRRISDYFLFDYMENKNKYSNFFKKELENEIINKLQLSNTIGVNSFDDLKKWKYEGFGYYIGPKNLSGTLIESKMYKIKSEDNIKQATGGVFVNFKVNNFNYPIDKTLEFFYLKSTISEYLNIYGKDINEYSSNDLLALGKAQDNKDFSSLSIDEKKIEALKQLLLFKEKEYIDSIYLQNSNNIISLNNVELTEDMKKQILKIVLNNIYNIYNKISSKGIIFNFSIIGKISEKQIDYFNCKITQLYGKSSVSSYPGGIHNGYDIVFTTKSGDKNVILRSMISGKVIVSQNANSVGNQVVIKSDIPIKTPDGKDIYPIVEYLHLSSISPEIVKGAKVSIGQQIGVQGNTGNSLGTHLHISGYLSGISPKCSGDLNSTNGYFCAVPFSQFFQALGYGNEIQSMGCDNVYGQGGGTQW